MFGIPARPPQSSEPEWMDTPGHPRAVIDDNLDDLRRVNRLLGGRRLTLLPLQRLARRLAPTERLTVLDVATGAADIPRAVCRWARSRNRPILVVASDVNEEVVRSGRDYAKVEPGLCFVAADATALPFRNRSFHVCASSLALHHMSPAEAVGMLAEQRRCASVGVIVNDIVRSWLAYFGAHVAVRFGSTNHLTRHDGPLSVLRAFTVPELRRLAHCAGLSTVEWDSFLFYRVALTAVPTDGR